MVAEIEAEGGEMQDLDNQFIAALFLYIVPKYNVDVIEHVFFQKGHSLMGD